MRILRRILIALVVLVALAGVAYLVFMQVEKWRMKQQLARQADEIAAHRQAQRAEAPDPRSTPASAPTSTAVTPAAAPAAVVPPAPAIAWTMQWAGFRGTRGDGRYAGGPILADWTKLQPLWRQPAGGGHGSFAAANGRVFTLEQRGPEEVAAAYDVVTGRELWTHGWKAAFVASMGASGPRATPAVHEGMVFVLGATGELRAIDASNGTLRWRANIIDDADASTLEWGVAASPLIAGNTVVTVPGSGSGRSIVAYDRATGRVAWSALDDQASYASPVRATLAGVEQIVVTLGSRVVGVSADRGALLWEFPWPAGGGTHASQPVVISDNRVFVSSSANGTGAAIEVTRDGERLSARQAWSTSRMKNDFTSSVHHDGFIYGLDSGILACIDAATGDVKWKAGRYGNGQMVLAGGHLVMTTEGGDVALVRATPERYQEVARISALEGQTYNHPAIVDGFLLVRNGTQMAAFDLRPR